MIISSKASTCLTEKRRKKSLQCCLCLLLRIVPNSLEFKGLVYSNITFFFSLLLFKHSFVCERFLSIIYLSKVNQNPSALDTLYFVQYPGVSALALCCVRLIIVSTTFEVISERDHIKAFN